MSITIDARGDHHAGEGTTDGGKYVTRPQAEPKLTRGLPTVDPDKNWGKTGIDVGSRSPWGEVDYAVQVADGITAVGTPGHGGVKLSAERNRAVHPSLRRVGGWYEEDCEAYIVGFTFPEETTPRRSIGYTIDKAVEDHYADAKDGIMRWFPDGYEAVTGETLQPGQSPVRDRALWTEAHKDALIGRSAINDPDNPGMVIVTARVGGTEGEDLRFRVSQDEYRQGRSSTDGAEGRFVVDPSRHEALGAIPKVMKEKFTGVSLDGLTEAGRTKAEKDLSKRWRSANGTVRTLRQVIENEGLSGKAVWVDGGRRKYSLSAQAYEGGPAYSYSVTKATWDAVDAPDERSDRQKLVTEIQVLQHAIDNEGNWQKSAVLSKKAAGLRAELNKL